MEMREAQTHARAVGGSEEGEEGAAGQSLVDCISQSKARNRMPCECEQEASFRVFDLHDAEASAGKWRAKRSQSDGKSRQAEHT
eukprot:833399-Rhodomonas_salina.1